MLFSYSYIILYYIIIKKSATSAVDEDDRSLARIKCAKSAVLRNSAAIISYAIQSSRLPIAAILCLVLEDCAWETFLE